MLGRLEKIGGKLWELLSRFILFVLRILLKPIHKELTEAQEQAFLQFCKFAIVGVSNTLISMGLNFCVLFICNKNGLLQKHDIKIYVANCVAFFLSVLWSFFWNNRYVFKEEEGAPKRVWWKTLLKSYVAYAFTGLGVSNLISWLCVTVLGINEYLAVIINLVIAVPVNFIINKFWAYGQKKTKKDA